MSRASLKAIQAAAGNAGGPVYVDDVFSTYLYTGTNATQAVVNGLDLAGEGGLIWTKARTSDPNELDHQLMDSEQGAFRYVLESNTTNARFDFGGSIVTPNSDGFTLSSASRVNQNGYPYASWSFRKQPGFFDVVTYTGNGTAGHTVNHSLGSTPGMIIFKRYDSALNWYVAHRYDLSKYLVLNQNAAAGSFAVVTATSDTTFTLPNDGSTNASGGSYVAYLFAHDAQEFGTDSDESIIKCDSYTGNGSADGPEIDLGFEPQWLMIKETTDTGNWSMMDNMRGIATGRADARFQANQSDAENINNNILDLTPTGFKLVSTDGNHNTSGQTYIYVAIRRPHKPASEFAATDLFTPTTQAASQNPAFVSNFPADFAINKYLTNAGNFESSSRINQGGFLVPNSNAAEVTSTDFVFDFNNGHNTQSGGPDTNSLSWIFRRAPGFFDVVAYSGTGSSGLVVDHNLGVTPELVIIKNRTYSPSDWPTLTTAVDGSWDYQLLNGTGAFLDATWFAASASDFTLNVATSRNVNYSGNNYISYLFATVPGISKVGSYTGTGSDVDVDCGFTSGARFVLVKRADSTGDWYVWDSLRGIVAGNDPYLRLNVAAAQVTSTDYIDPLSSGFTITSSAPAALNASGGNYIFLAIA